LSTPSLASAISAIYLRTPLNPPALSTSPTRRSSDLVSKQIAEKKRNKEDASDAIAAMREVGKEIKDLDKEVAELTEKQNYILLRLPNFPADSDPIGPDDSYNEEVRKWHPTTEFNFKPKAHWDIGTDLGILDWDRASKVSGARFVYYIGAGALLERAVFNFFLDENTK